MIKYKVTVYYGNSRDDFFIETIEEPTWTSSGLYYFLNEERIVTYTFPISNTVIKRLSDLTKEEFTEGRDNVKHVIEQIS